MALWKHGEDMTAARRNREAIIGRLTGLPVYDEQQLPTVAVTVTQDRFNTLMSSTPATLYTPPAGGWSQIDSLSILNNDSVERQIDLWLLNPGDINQTLDNQIWTEILQPNDRRVIRGPWLVQGGGLLQGRSQDVSNVVNVLGTILDYDALPSGVTFKSVRTALTTTPSALYTVPASGVTQSLLLNYTLVNVDEVVRRPAIWRLPTGQVVGNSHLLFNDDLIEFESIVERVPVTLFPSDAVWGYGTANSVLTSRLTIVEFT
jgi:hypothetical protein